MRLTAWLTLVAFALTAPAAAQDSARNPALAKSASKSNEKKSEKKADTKKETGAKKKTTAKKDAEKPTSSEAAPAPATPAQKEAYAALPVAERLAIQSDLIWAHHLTGGLDAEFGDRAIAAVRAFQRRLRHEDTGILTKEERQTLAAATKARKDAIDWQLVEDNLTPGVRLGIPAKLVPRTEEATTGTRWSSARGEIQIETFRENMAGSSLNALYEEMKRRPANRRVEYGAIQQNSFVLSGLQGLKRFHVRVTLKDNEARGLTILYDQAMDGIMLPMADVIGNSHVPFGDPATSSLARKIQYGSGIAVSRAGHIVRSRQLTDRCQSLVVAGLGRAEQVKDDNDVGLSLLQVNGARGVKPLAFSDGPPKGRDLTLAGIAEPGLQAGAREVTTTGAVLLHVNGSRVLMDANPARGFIGGAALDGAGQFAGMIDSLPATTGGPSRNGGQPSFVPAATIRNFLQTAGVDPRSDRGDLAAAKDAIVRVICVRQ